MARQRLGPSTVALAVSGGGEQKDLPAPPQDMLILDCLAQEPVGRALIQRVCNLSCEGCPAYRGELAECWNILYHVAEKSPQEVVCGSISYLQGRYADEVKASVYSASGSQLGGVADSWALVRAFGRARFESDAFPADVTQVWYAAYVAARAGFAELLSELPERAPGSGHCPAFRAVCRQMAARLRASSPTAGAPDAPAPSGADQADLLSADPGGAGGPFREALVSLLQGQSFSVSRRLNGTVEDWLWFRLHLALGQAGRAAPDLLQQLEAVSQDVARRPQSHYDPAAGASSPTGSTPPPGAAYGLGALVDPFASSALALPGGSSLGVGIAQTLNFVKALLLTAQFDRAIQQMGLQDRCLQAPALHMALVLRKAGTLGVVPPATGTCPPLDVAALVREYGSRFRCADQLRYFQTLDAADRKKAIEQLLLGPGVLASDELLGPLDAGGQHQPGLLERALQQDGGSAEFGGLCAKAGSKAAERGQYREALRLLHMGGCHGEALQVLCRCLRLPLWREASAEASDEARLLAGDIQRFFALYERNLDRYALPSRKFAVARKLFSARIFHSLCSQGQVEAALDTFDREQLLPLSMDQALGGEVDEELLPEYPRIVADYARALCGAAARGAGAGELRARVGRLQAFLAVQSHRVPLDQETLSALAGLVLC